MTYGLCRDDSGRFMRDYVNRGVFPEDPFHSLDVEGVGELMLIAAKRGRARNPDLTLGLCGEHGGDPSSVQFCKIAGFDYVSCSPFRVPIARLAAAQATILAAGRRGDGPGRMTSLPGSLAALAAGGKAALARCLSALETAPDDPALIALLDAALPRAAGRRPRPDRSARGRQIHPDQRADRPAARRGKRVAVIAVDPSSRRSGGALLGDRTRIETDPARRGRVRALDGGAAAAGGVARLTFPAAVLMRASSTGSSSRPSGWASPRPRSAIAPTSWCSARNRARATRSSS